MQDPTRDEMLETINAWPYRSEADEFDVEEAIYWFAADNHGGQSSNLYSALSMSEYSPGPMRRGPDDGMAGDLYELLQDKFA